LVVDIHVLLIKIHYMENTLLTKQNSACVTIKNKYV